MVLQVTGLTTGYGKVPVLRDISLKVDEGEVVCLIGPNGAGKTTLINSINGLVRSWSGTITLGGQEIGGLPSHEVVKNGVITVPQGRTLFPHMTLRENLEMGAYLVKGRSELKRRLARVIELYPWIEERSSQKAGTLSGGEQKMVEIARALMQDPKILLLDEPFLGLAPLVIQRILNIVSSLKTQGVTILLVEQNAKKALEVGERGYVLELGRIVLEDRADRLVENPEVARSYLGG